MATKKDIADIKAAINKINVSIKEMRESLIQENVALRDRIRKLEIKAGKSEQYSMRSNIIIKGISKEVEKDELENKVIRL